MRVLATEEGQVVIFSYDGSIQSIQTQNDALSVLKQVNNLESKQILSIDEANQVRGSIMVAFKDIDTIEVYAASKKHAVVTSRVQYRQQVVADVVSTIVDGSSGIEDKVIHLVRGVTGSGKTTYTKQLCKDLDATAYVETDLIKERLFSDFWALGAGVCPEPRQLHKEASLICKDVVEELCRRNVGFILVQRFEKIEDAERIVRISKEFGYSWHIYSITPDYVDIARNNVTRSRSLYNINTFSPNSLQKSITKYTETATYFYRLAALSSILSMCDVRQQAHGVFSETFYKKDGANIYIDRDPSLHARLLTSRESKQIEEYAIFDDADMHRYEDFFYRNNAYKEHLKLAALHSVNMISRTARGEVNLENKDQDTAKALEDFYSTQKQETRLSDAVDYIYNQRYRNISSTQDLRDFIVDVAKRVIGLDDEHIFRHQEVGKYIAADDVDNHFNDFLAHLLHKMKHDKNRVYVAAYILWSIDFTGHYFADGCSRVSVLIASWYLMRTGHDLPEIKRRLDHESSTRSSYRGRHHIEREDIYNGDINYQKFMQFYAYYKSLFVKSARPTIPCAGGYVFNSKGEVLLLRSAKGKDIGKYVVPGGKMDRNESPEECFRRETFEEAGIAIKNVTYIGKRRYVGPSGRRYLMHDFTAQAVSSDVHINNESIASEWVMPIDIDPQECTASTLNGLNRYLHLDAVIESLPEMRTSIFSESDTKDHATGLLADAYISKKLATYSWALKLNPKKVFIHGIIPFKAAVDSILPKSSNIESRSGLIEKDRNSNALRPSSYFDHTSNALHLFNFPGDDILQHYAMLFSKYAAQPAYDISIVRYPKIDDKIFYISGLTNQLVRGGDIVYLGYSTRFKEFLNDNHFEPITVSENFWYISSRFRVGDSILNVLECKYGHWGDISARLTEKLCELGVKGIIHSGKVGTLVNQSEVYSRIYIPREFLIFHPDPSDITQMPIENFLSSFVPFQSGGHISCASPLEETNKFLDSCNSYHIETVDIESAKIAEAISIYNDVHNSDVMYGAIHYASDYVGKPDDESRSYNLSNEHDRSPQVWKDAVLSDIFGVIAEEVKRIIN
jgi:ADP-ribose pyrophosphatase YjhB (NUDIX family)/deoxyadenosine/deoxycytidine kinase